MSNALWLPISSAPKDREILVYGGEFWCEDANSSTLPLTSVTAAWWNASWGEWFIGEMAGMALLARPALWTPMPSPPPEPPK